MIDDDLQAIIENVEKLNYDEEAKLFVYEEPTPGAPKEKFGETWSTDINNKVSFFIFLNSINFIKRNLRWNQTN